MHRSVSIALAEVGYVEKQDRRELDEKLSNPGDENFTKYARDLDAHLGFYWGFKQGMPWCDVFVDWCFVQAYGTGTARRMLCQPILSRGAGCRYSFGYFMEAGRIYPEPLPGDQIFFQKNGHICHTGLVTAVDAACVYTVEGNTADTDGIEENGGCVREKRYALNDPGIAGYGRPDYALAGDIPAGK